MDLAGKIEKLRDVYEEAAAKGRMNPDIEDEIDERIMKVEERVNPTGATMERYWKWGVGLSLSFVMARILLD